MSTPPRSRWLRPVVQTWRENRDTVERALQHRGPRVCWAAMNELGVVDATLDLYYEVCCRYDDERERPEMTLYHLSSMAAMFDEEAGPDDALMTRMTANDLLAWEIIEAQTPNGPDGGPRHSYWGDSATRHSWLVAAAGISAVDLSRHPGPVRYEDLRMLAALRGVRVPPLTPGEEFEPPSRVFTHPFQEVMRFPGGWSFSSQRRLVDRPGLLPDLPPVRDASAREER